MDDAMNGEMRNFQGFTEVDHVFLQEDTRLYRATVVLAVLDSETLDFDQSKVEFAQPLPVYDEDSRLLGFASGEVRNGKVVAEIQIDYACPERLSAQLKEGVKFYPRMVGTILLKTSKEPFLDLYAPKRKVDEIQVASIVLATQHSGDGRLGALGEPVLT